MRESGMGSKQNEDSILTPRKLYKAAALNGLLSSGQLPKNMAALTIVEVAINYADAMVTEDQEHADAQQLT